MAPREQPTKRKSFRQGGFDGLERLPLIPSGARHCGSNPITLWETGHSTVAGVLWRLRWALGVCATAHLWKTTTGEGAAVGLGQRRVG
jgi:hypothetical protein